MKLAGNIAKAVFFGSLVIELGKDVKKKNSVVRHIDDNGEFVIGGGEFERAVADLDDHTKGRNTVMPIAFRIDDPAVVERDVGKMKVALYDEKTGHF